MFSLFPPRNAVTGRAMTRAQVDAGPLRELIRHLTQLPREATGEPVSLAPAVLAVLGTLVPADVVVFNDLAPHRQSAWAESITLPNNDLPEDEGGDDQQFWDQFWSSAASHPDRSGDRESATTLTDFLTLREWRRSTMYAVLRRKVAFDRQLLLPLAGPSGHSRRVRFLRLQGRDFDDTDRALAALVRPHLVGHLHTLDLTSRGIRPLTTRQRQLLALVADGFSNAQVARTLGITADTVRTHLQQVYARLGVTSRGEAVALAHPPRDRSLHRRAATRLLVPSDHADLKPPATPETGGRHRIVAPPPSQ
jgi:DNA-binding CsgD family transcriptional regulator